MENVHLKAITGILIKAGEEILKIYQSSDFGMELKDDKSPVTKADKISSRIINQSLKKLYPKIPLLDEENPIPPYSERKNWPQFFLVDPLDGTKEFLKKNGEFCINLARIENGFPVEGWIFHPVSQIGWYSGFGNGIWEFDKFMNFSRINPAEKATEKLNLVVSRSFFNQQEMMVIELIRKRYDTELIQLGSSLKQVWLVKGKADVYLKAGSSSEWDTASGQLMVEEAKGSVFTIPDFKRMNYNKPLMGNPGFFMVTGHYNNQEFINLLRRAIECLL